MQTGQVRLIALAFSVAYDAVLGINAGPGKVGHVLKSGPGGVSDQDSSFPIGAAHYRQEPSHFLGVKRPLLNSICFQAVSRSENVIVNQLLLKRALHRGSEIFFDLVDRRGGSAFLPETVPEIDHVLFGNLPHATLGPGSPEKL